VEHLMRQLVSESTVFADRQIRTVGIQPGFPDRFMRNGLDIPEYPIDYATDKPAAVIE